MPTINRATPATKGEIARSPQWPALEAAHRKRQPVCACCGNPDAPIQVHHIFPFHICVALGRPDLELDERNLISLCQGKAGVEAPDHHLLLGHLDSFQSLNLEVEEDARRFQGLSEAGLRGDPHWQAKAHQRLKPLEELSPDERTALRKAMDTRFPRQQNET
jgi:hypothetical protein